MSLTNSLFAFFSGAAMALAVPVYAQSIYVTDQGHTEVLVEWKHVGVVHQHAEFTRAKATLTIDLEDPSQAQVEVDIDPSSFSSGWAPLDAELKGPQFLNVEAFPNAHFESTNVQLTGLETATITGDLTLHGVTRAVVLDATLTHRGEHPTAQYVESFKGDWLAFHATTQIDHQDWGVGPFSTGLVKIDVYTEMKRQ